MQLRRSRIFTMLQGLPEIVGSKKRQADVCCRPCVPRHVRSFYTPHDSFEDIQSAHLLLLEHMVDCTEAACEIDRTSEGQGRILAK